MNFVLDLGLRLRQVETAQCMYLLFVMYLLLQENPICGRELCVFCSMIYVCM